MFYIRLVRGCIIRFRSKQTTGVDIIFNCIITTKRDYIKKKTLIIPIYY